MSATFFALADRSQSKVITRKNAAKAMVAEYVVSMGAVTVGDVAAHHGFSRETVQRYLREMADEGITAMISPSSSDGHGVSPALWAMAGYNEEDRSDDPVRPVTQSWPVGMARRDHMVAALFGAAGVAA